MAEQNKTERNGATTSSLEAWIHLPYRLPIVVASKEPHWEKMAMITQSLIAPRLPTILLTGYPDIQIPHMLIQV